MSVNPADKFKGTASWYRAYRPGLEPEVARAILDAVKHVDRPRSLLDLGTGTGQVIEALADEFDLCVGVDNELEMIVEARSVMTENDRVRWVHGGAETARLPDELRPALITICRAFHWMDQSAVLERTARLAPPDGRLIVLGDSSFWTTEGPWKDIVRETIKGFLGKKRRAGSGTFAHHNRPYDEVIAESKWSRIEIRDVPVHRTWSIDSVLGYLYSTSFSSQDLYGDRLHEFDEQLRSQLANFEREGGTLDESVEFKLFIGSLAS